MYNIGIILLCTILVSFCVPYWYHFLVYHIDTILQYTKLVSFSLYIVHIILIPFSYLSHWYHSPMYHIDTILLSITVIQFSYLSHWYHFPIYHIDTILLCITLMPFSYAPHWCHTWYFNILSLSMHVLCILSCLVKLLISWLMFMAQFQYFSISSSFFFFHDDLGLPRQTHTFINLHVIYVDDSWLASSLLFGNVLLINLKFRG